MDETDQFEDNRTKVVASRCANSTMMKGYVTTASTPKNNDNNFRKTNKQKHRIVEPRRPGSFFIDTSLLGRIHSISDGRTITTTNTTTTATTNSNSTYRDNPHHIHLDHSQVDLTMSKLNDVPPPPLNPSRRLR